MTNFTELRQQHHEIAELIKVLSVLHQDVEACNTAPANELHDRMIAKFDSHLALKDKIFSGYLTHGDESLRRQASNFLSGSKTISSIYQKYKRCWRAREERCGKHADFIKDSNEFFEFAMRLMREEEDKCNALLDSIGKL